MGYELVILPIAERQLRALDRDIAKRIVKKLFWIADQSELLRFAIILHRSTAGDIRFRIGDYRAVAWLDRKRCRISIAAIGHRREIYR